METAKVAETVPLRIQCSECKRFYNAISKPNGEIDGKCPFCHAKYHEHMFTLLVTSKDGKSVIKLNFSVSGRVTGVSFDKEVIWF